MFDAFVVSRHENPSLRFEFLRAAATADDPVLISAVGRKFKETDRQYRTDLQKVWLHRYVPSGYNFLVRSLVEKCGMKLPGEFHACDEYDFKDPATGHSFSYFIYVGNWPD